MVRAKRDASPSNQPAPEPSPSPQIPSIRPSWAARATLDVLQLIFAAGAVPGLQFRLWNGSRWPVLAGDPRATIVLTHPGALRAMLLPPTEASIGKAFARGDFDVEGDIVAAIGLGDAIQRALAGPGRLASIMPRLAALPNRREATAGIRRAATLEGATHSTARDKDAITYHYDLPGDFYALFLDRQLQYSCAYFRHPEDGLDVAQTAKLDHICRKLDLRAGERLLDIGCGWGGLIAHAAEKFGVEAIGITNSSAQAERARARIAAMGLGDRCRVELCDYRQVETLGSFDKLVSVGMFEHVGRRNLPLYFKKAYDVLAPGGRFLCHGISGIVMPPMGWVQSAVFKWLYASGGFIRQYVFPDGETIPISATLSAAEESGFEVRDVESLREHYALTLRHWVQRLESHRQEAIDLVGEGTYRVWRLYMAGSAFSFEEARNNVHQSLLIKSGPGGRSGLPATREYMYPTRATG